MKKRVFTMLLVVAMLMSFMTPLAASAEEYTALTLGEDVAVTLSVGESQWYQFTPENSMQYLFKSSAESGVDPRAKLYDSSMQLIAENDDSDGANFCIKEALVAGETYYLEALEHDSDNAGSYTLSVSIALPTDVFFDEYSVETFVGTEYTVTAHIYPEDANKTLTWTSSDETVATVDNNGKVTFLSEGETSITAETPNGLQDTCWFTVHAVEGSLQLGTEKTVEFVGVETRKETQQYFTFTPAETGYYRLYSYDIVSELADLALDPRVWVYDVLHGELGYNDDGGEDVNVSVQVALEAGETYYFMTELYDSKAVGSIKIKMEKMITAESVTIDCGDLVLDQGNCMDIYVTYSPEGSWQEEYVVTSSDESVVKVQDKTILAVGGGEATVTVTSELGLTDSITVTVIGCTELELDKTYTLEGTPLNMGGNERYMFTPTESGRYTITSSEAIGEGADVSVNLNDVNNWLRYNDTDSTSFKLTYELKANEMYFYEVSLNCNGESSVDFVLTKEDNSEIPEIKLNTEHTIEITNPGDGGYYVFKPLVTGRYAITSIPDEINVVDTKLEVFNEAWEMFYSNDDGAGNSQFLLEEEFVAGETYYLKAIIYSNDVIGTFKMSVEPLFEYPKTGDTNDDGEVTAYDALTALEYANGQNDSLTELGKALADVNGDGVVTAYDALMILQFANGTIDSLD